ncbi:dTMP kinase [Streptomyces sp. NPDC050433]|uniref:dTMP kinase n=1 Tax=Streptomyces sp. NPDC050433 TaxID=3365615 RepID=UPI0037B3AE02
MKVIAVEGPSYAGKSTAIRHLRRHGYEGRAYIADCYVKQIGSRDAVPPARTASATEQVAAFETFMAVEETRVRTALAAAKPFVILDRSVDTLLAHAYALDALFGYAVQHRLRDRLQVLPHLSPDHTVYLDVPAEVLGLRRKTSGHTAAEPDYFLHEPTFLTHTRDYFLTHAQPPVSREVTVVPADTSPEAIAHAVEALVSYWTR